MNVRNEMEAERCKDPACEVLVLPSPELGLRSRPTAHRGIEDDSFSSDEDSSTDSESYDSDRPLPSIRGASISAYTSRLSRSSTVRSCTNLVMWTLLSLMILHMLLLSSKTYSQNSVISQLKKGSRDKYHMGEETVVKTVNSVVEGKRYISTRTGEEAQFVVYRIIGNDLPPRHAVGQTLTNVGFLLRTEPDLDRCEKRWVLNRVTFADQRAKIKRLLRSYGQKYVEVQFHLDEFVKRHYYYAGFPEDSDLLNHPHRRFANANTHGRIVDHLYHQKNKYVFNNNGARNAALWHGRNDTFDWILPLDGNCFFGIKNWEVTLDFVDNEVEASFHTPFPILYLIMHMSRIPDNDLLLDPKYVPLANEEPQIGFHKWSTEYYNENMRYGRRPKVELLWRFEVPGHWMHWPKDVWEPEESSALNAGRSKHTKLWRFGSWTSRMFSGSKGQESGKNALFARGAKRREAVVNHIDKIYASIREPDWPGDIPLMMDYQLIAEQKKRYKDGDLVVQKMVRKLLSIADAVLPFKPYSVLNKTTVAPSGDKQDYWRPVTNWFPSDSENAIDGFPYVMKDHDEPAATTKYDKASFDAMVVSTKLLSLAYFMTEDEKYAAKASEFVRTWFVTNETRMNPHLIYSHIFAPRLENANLTGSELYSTEENRYLILFVSMFGNKYQIVSDAFGTAYDLDKKQVEERYSAAYLKKHYIYVRNFDAHWSGIGLRDTKLMNVLCDAVKLFQSSPHWSDTDDELFKAWLDSYVEWARYSEEGTEATKQYDITGTYIDSQYVAMSAYKNDIVLVSRYLCFGRMRMMRQFRADGDQSLREFYSPFVKPVSLQEKIDNLFTWIGVVKLGQVTWVHDLCVELTPDGRSVLKALQWLIYDYQRLYELDPDRAGKMDGDAVRLFAMLQLVKSACNYTDAEVFQGECVPSFIQTAAQRAIGLTPLAAITCDVWDAVGRTTALYQGTNVFGSCKRLMSLILPRKVKKRSSTRVLLGGDVAVPTEEEERKMYPAQIFTDVEQEEKERYPPKEVRVKPNFGGPVELDVPEFLKKTTQCDNITALYEPSSMQFLDDRVSRHPRILMYAQHSGFSNQLIALRNAIRVAYLLNRTLVVAPIIDHKAVKYGSCRVEVTSNKRLWTDYNSAIKAILSRDEYVGVSTVLDLSEIGKFIQYIDTKQYREKLGGLQLDTYEISNNCFDTQWIVDLPELEGKVENDIVHIDLMKELAGRQETVLKFGSMFGSKFIKFSPVVEAMDVFRKTEIFTFSTPIVKAAKTLKSRMGEYSSLHVRMSKEFKEHDDSTVSYMLKRLSSNGIKPNSTIYIATDLPASEIYKLDPFRERYTVYTVIDFMDVVEELRASARWPQDPIAYLEQMLCVCASNYFFGTPFSTYSANIALLREHNACMREWGSSASAEMNAKNLEPLIRAASDGGAGDEEESELELPLSYCVDYEVTSTCEDDDDDDALNENAPAISAEQIVPEAIPERADSTAPVTFMFTARDSHGTRLASGGNHFGSHGKSVESGGYYAGFVTDAGNGEYSVSVEVGDEGPVDIFVYMIRDDHSTKQIKGSPFRVQVSHPAGTSPALNSRGRWDEVDCEGHSGSLCKSPIYAGSYRYRPSATTKDPFPVHELFQKWIHISGGTTDYGIYTSFIEGLCPLQSEIVCYDDATHKLDSHSFRGPGQVPKWFDPPYVDRKAQKWKETLFKCHAENHVTFHWFPKLQALISFQNVPVDFSEPTTFSDVTQIIKLEIIRPKLKSWLPEKAKMDIPAPDFVLLGFQLDAPVMLSTFQQQLSSIVRTRAQNFPKMHLSIRNFYPGDYATESNDGPCRSMAPITCMNSAIEVLAKEGESPMFAVFDYWNIGITSDTLSIPIRMPIDNRAVRMQAVSSLLHSVGQGLARKEPESAPAPIASLTDLAYNANDEEYACWSEDITNVFHKRCSTWNYCTGRPKASISPKSLDPANYKLEGVESTYEVGPVHFTVVSDAMHGGSTFSALLIGDGLVNLRMADHGNGTYTASGFVGKAGNYELHVLLETAGCEARKVEEDPNMILQPISDSPTELSFSGSVDLETIDAKYIGSGQWEKINCANKKGLLPFEVDSCVSKLAKEWLYRPTDPSVQRLMPMDNANKKWIHFGGGRETFEVFETIEALLSASPSSTTCMDSKNGTIIFEETRQEFVQRASHLKTVRNKFCDMRKQIHLKFFPEIHLAVSFSWTATTKASPLIYTSNPLSKTRMLRELILKKLEVKKSNPDIYTWGLDTHIYNGPQYLYRSLTRFMETMSYNSKGGIIFLGAIQQQLQLPNNGKKKTVDTRAHLDCMNDVAMNLAGMYHPTKTRFVDIWEIYGPLFEMSRHQLGDEKSVGVYFHSLANTYWNVANQILAEKTT